MNGNEPAQRIWFIIVFFIVAFIINSTPHLSSSTQNVRPQQQVAANDTRQQLEMQREATAQKAAADAAQERATFLARYLNADIPKSPGIEAFALVVATQDGKPDSAVSMALVNRFKSDSIKISTSFFRPEFVSDNLFASVFDGSPEFLTKLELANSLDALLLGRETVKFSRNPASLDNVLSAHVQLQIQVVPIAGNVQHKSWTFTANGAGFSQAEALSMAEGRLIKQISNDTTMSLASSSN